MRDVYGALVVRRYVFESLTILETRRGRHQHVASLGLTLATTLVSCWFSPNPSACSSRRSVQ